MATTYPSDVNPRRVRLRLPFVMIAAVVVIVIAVVALYFTRSNAVVAPDPSNISDVTRGPLVDAIAATGKVAPRQSAALAFADNTNVVSQVLVAEGDTVKAGAPLVTLDSRQLRANVAAAQAVLTQAEADFAIVQAGATSADVAAARAAVGAAEATLRQTQGSVTNADVQAAQLQIDQARAKVAAVKGNPNRNDVARAEAAVTEAQTTVTSEQNALSATKTAAEHAVAVAANALRDAQSSYKQALADKQRVIRHTTTDPQTGGPLTESARQVYIEQADIAAHKLQDADNAFDQAKVAYEASKQNEITGITAAEAKVQSVLADLDALQNPTTEAIAAAGAELATAQARLAQLTGEQRSGTLAAQRSEVAVAQAKLEGIVAGPSDSSLARAKGHVDEATAQLGIAQLKLDNATLSAPFAGVITAVTIAPGEAIGATAPITISDISHYIIKVPVDEVDIARIQVGQPAEIVIDALGNEPLAGKVQKIAPQAQSDKTITAYAITLEFDPSGRPIKSGMTASSRIIVARKDSALSVPFNAVQMRDGAWVVQVLNHDANNKQSIALQKVQIGNRFGDRIEILSGVTAGQKVLLTVP